jgi:hypothetical protein
VGSHQTVPEATLPELDARFADTLQEQPSIAIAEEEIGASLPRFEM